MFINENGLYVEVRNRKRCFLEGVTSILDYGDNSVLINSKSCTVLILGENLTMDYLSEDRLGINGKITSVSFKEKETRHDK